MNTEIEINGDSVNITVYVYGKKLEYELHAGGDGLILEAIDYSENPDGLFDTLFQHEYSEHPMMWSDDDEEDSHAAIHEALEASLDGCKNDCEEIGCTRCHKD